jgi:dihydropteroate synthase-like protein
MMESATPAPSRVLFVTGKLAEPALRRTLAEMEAPFTTEVAVLRITVAALMTTPWIARFLEVPSGTDLVLIPGLCEGDPEVIGRKVGVRVEKGPADLREIPEYFGQVSTRREYGAWDIRILAEINNAPRMTREEIRREAEYFRREGADVIDVGCTPGLPFPELRSVVRELVTAGFEVSIDSLDPAEIREGVEGGASLVLSLSSQNVDVARQLRGSSARFVVIPDADRGLDSIQPTLDKLEEWGVAYLIDPVVEPVAFGFTQSLARYVEARHRWPEAELMMGVGNVTELTAADSTGVNALLIGICQELGIRTVLTTEVIPWARGAVREIDIARRLMHYAVTERVLPKKLDDRLVTVKDPKILAYTEAELRELQRAITDSNYRIFTDRHTIYVFNRDRFVSGTEIQDIFEQLEVDEPTHAFYLGKELAKAKLAITLGKSYRQEGSLRWGYLTPPDDPIREHVKLTQRRAPRRRDT